MIEAVLGVTEGMTATCLRMHTAEAAWLPFSAGQSAFQQDRTALGLTEPLLGNTKLQGQQVLQPIPATGC